MVTIIGEIGSNWESFKDVEDSVEVIRLAGGIPKLQAFKAEEICQDKNSEYYAKLKSVELPREWMKRLESTNVFYSIFGLDTLAFLESKIMPFAYKIASGKAVDKGLIKAVAATGKPTYLSVGGCTLDEIRQAVKWFEEGSGDMLWWTKLTLMHCVVSYPAECAYMGNLRDRISGSKLIQWGYSDHTTDLVAPVMATTLGAMAIEKHFSLRPMNTPDNGHSLYPPHFEEMVKNIRLAEHHLKTQEQPLKEELSNLRLARGYK